MPIWCSRFPARTGTDDDVAEQSIEIYSDQKDGPLVVADVVEAPSHPVARPQAATRGWAWLDAVPWSLVVILAAQATLSLRLIWTNTAFLDEATYLYAGHVELAHWLHGTAAPEYATYFSGAPVIYRLNARAQ